MENALYLLQVSGCTCAFYAVYIIFLRNSTFFRANRIYLIGALLFSFVIPVLDFSTVAVDYHLPATDFLAAAALPVLNMTPQSISVTPDAANFNFIFLIYWLGFTVIIGRFFYSIVRLLLMKIRVGVCRKGAMRIVHTELPQPFSFFNLIFLPKGEEVSPLIFQHEKAHVYYRHWIDLMLVEISSAVLWFNPLMIFYQRSIKIQHEYEADNYVIRNRVSIGHYLDCILRHLQMENLPNTVSQFYSQNIKKRIVMMTRKKTPFRFSLLYTLFIPVAALLLFAFAEPSVRTVTFSEDVIVGKDEQVVIIVDPGHGGHDAGVNKNGLSEKDFALTMARNIQKTGEAKNIKVMLTRTDDKAMALEERVNLANRYPAAVFISIHANYDMENTAASGIECVVSEKNSRFQDSERLAGNLMQEFQTLNGISVREIKKSDAYILSRNSIPAILLELGYFSNKADKDYLNDKRNQQQISEKIIAAVLQYSK